MEVFLLFVVLIGIVVLVAVAKGRRRASEDRFRAESPLDPALDEVFMRPFTSGRRLRRAEDALRSATPLILGATAETRAHAILAVHSDEIVDDGLLVVTTLRPLSSVSGSCAPSGTGRAPRPRSRRRRAALALPSRSAATRPT